MVGQSPEAQVTQRALPMAMGQPCSSGRSPAGPEAALWGLSSQPLSGRTRQGLPQPLDHARGAHSSARLLPHHRRRMAPSQGTSRRAPGRIPTHIRRASLLSRRERGRVRGQGWG
jgi:hypothetical protein